MRRGMSPKDAGVDACRRIAKNTVEKRLLNKRGLPNFGIQFYLLNARGEHAGVTMYKGARYAVCDESGPHFEECAVVFEGAPGE
jgi:N4-(beta-N-acetylglucosaminyl)-L-asparaginase